MANVLFSSTVAAVLGAAPESSLRFLVHHDGGSVDTDLQLIYNQIGLPCSATIERSINGGSSWSTVGSGIALRDGIGPFQDLAFTYETTNLYRVTVSAGATAVAVLTDDVYPVSIPPRVKAWQYVAQNLITGAFLHWNMPLKDVQITDTLSGAAILNATLAASQAGDVPLRWADLLVEWQTAIYAEEEGEIRGGGIVKRFNNGAIECIGFAGYAHGIPYLGNYSKKSVDPLDAVREIWRHIQSYRTPAGDIGLEVDPTTTPVRLGTDPEHLPSTGAAEPISNPGEPYTLVWWEAPDCGDEIDQLVQQTPFDYREEHSWFGTRIRHRLVLGYPRLGRRRDDLRFAVGENISVIPEPDRDGDEYANVSYGIGKGEGQKALHKELPLDDGRLRRPHVWTDALVSDPDRMYMKCLQDVILRMQLVQLAELTVTDHPSAPLGSFGVGDDILVRAVLPWHGDFALWVRILAYTINPDKRGIAVLSVQRSDSFTYGELELQTVNAEFS